MNLTNDDKVQQKLLRVRPPRVKITYEVETGGAIEQVEIPFIVGIFASLSGDTAVGTGVLPSASSQAPDSVQPATKPLSAYKDRAMVEIDRDSFNTVLNNSAVSVNLSTINNSIDALTPPIPGAPPASPTLSGALSFSTFDDFLPGNVVYNIPKLREYAKARAGIRELQSKADASDAIAQLLDAIVALNNATTLKASITSQLPAATATDTLGTQAASWGITSGAVGGSATFTGADVNTSGAVSIPVTATYAASGSGSVTVSGTVSLALAAPASGTLTGVISGTNVIDGSGTIQLKGTLTGTVTASGSFSVAVSGSASVAGTLLTPLQPSFDTSWPPASGTIAPRLLGEIVGPAPAASDTVASAAYEQSIINASTLLGYFSQQVLSQPVPSSGKAARATQLIDQRVVAIDAGLSQQLSTILHAPNFQRLEATWRGLHDLVFNSETGGLLKLRVFNAAKQDLIDDLDQAVEFDQSKLFKMIYEAEYGTYGGFPYSLLMGDYEFSSSDADIDLLSKFTQVAAAAHAPLISAASPALFGLPDFSLLAKPRDLSQIFEGISWANWNAFRDTEDSRYVTLVLPHTLLRQPYDYRLAAVPGFNFVEDITAGGTPLDATVNNPGDPATPITPGNKNFLWGNAAYALTGRITNAFALYRWTAAIRGEEGGGLVDGLPLYIYPSDLGAPVAFCPTEVSITDRREKELNDLGFVALCHRKNTAQAVFFGGQTVNLPKRYVSDSANANAKTSAMLPYMLAASRFAHYIKVMMRKKIGSFLTRGNIESYINTWIAQYVLLDDNASQEVKASYPLRAAEVVVTEIPGEPGSYNATLFIKPHFQLEDLHTSIRLVADLPKV
ncbi:type VI secretion system contractile sheath large subunit [Andreprevotia chitinilytica]|uniref:type VI secretion system contractile sheath large subunit n=1 Tax=Andreprevotia chitinilytica TaxID=396808 RepID=UPI000A03F780|nr:type VI secretion system contractile sheath large subunit [Andreprevotia chitinilytica]